jgi:molecular chaperone DnaJ
MTAAALGTVLSLDTFDGARDLDLAPGTQAGDVVTLRGLGVTHLRGTGRGDLIVHADVVTPTKLTEAQQDLLRQLAALRGEERPVGRVAAADKGGFMGKLRDAFKGA